MLQAPAPFRPFRCAAQGDAGSRGIRYSANVTHLLVSARNIDEQKTKELEYQKNLEEAAAEAHRANEAKTNFLRRMSHDKPLQINEVVAAIAHCYRKEP